MHPLWFYKHQHDNLKCVVYDKLLKPRQSFRITLCLYTCEPTGRDSSVGIATRYGLDGPGIESRWGRDFPHPFRPALDPTQPPIQWVPGLYRFKAAGAWRCQPPPSSAEVKERIELYLHSPSGPSWPLLGWNLPLPLPLPLTLHM